MFLDSRRTVAGAGAGAGVGVGANVGEKLMSCGINFGTTEQQQ